MHPAFHGMHEPPQDRRDIARLKSDLDERKPVTLPIGRLECLAELPRRQAVEHAVNVGLPKRQR